MSDLPYTQDRELSWLAFNDRVLSEALDESVPLLERLKFAAIFTSNLDEFFMIRVGSLFDLANLDPDTRDVRSGMTPREQLDAIYEAVRPLYRKREHICTQLSRRLEAEGIRRVGPGSLSSEERNYCARYFESCMEPVISPQIVDSLHPFPHLKNNVLHVGAWVERKGREMLAVIPMPEALSPLLYLPGPELRYIHTEDLLLERVEDIFKNYRVLEKAVFRITRNADISPDDEAFELDNDDFRKTMRRAIRKRMRLAPVRLELSRKPCPAFLAYLTERLPVSKKQIFVTSAPLCLDYAYSLPLRLDAEKRAVLSYPSFEPQEPEGISPSESMIRQIQRADRLLSYPYESMSPFLRLLRESANDPSVISIKITIYRLASKAKLVDYLCEAAERGKDVTVIIELRARFDELNNIDWSERLEEAGCTVLYGFEDYKIHSKLCLITRREHGEIRCISYVGTGNFNEKTARQYTDLALLTADPAIGRDAAEFFKNMCIANLDGRYERLLVAPSGLKSGVEALIDREIAKGESGRMLIKINSLTDIGLIRKLREASRAGVRVDLIVRGICCILPGVPGETENIRVVSIVGRYLEHSRIYCFGEGADEVMYISSADFMTRNTRRRVEVACPVTDADARRKLHRILDACLSDNVKARLLLPDGSYTALPRPGEPLDCQELLMREAVENAPSAPIPRRAVRLVGRIFRRLRGNISGDTSS